VAKLIQICASENDLFALDGEGSCTSSISARTTGWSSDGTSPEMPPPTCRRAVGRAGPETPLPFGLGLR